MAQSDVEIINDALILLGASPINTLDDATKEARTMKRIYDPTRRQLIANHPWKSTTRRLYLTADATPPAFGWGARFKLPNDYIRVFDTDQGTEVPWTTENGYLFCSHTNKIGIKYGFDQKVAGEFDEGFCAALTHRLAHKAAYAITQSSALAQRLGAEFLVVLRDAKAQNAQEGNGDQVQANEWLYSRF